MPVLGLIAIGRFFLRIPAALWRKQEFRGLLLIALITILSGTWFYHQFMPTITTWVDAYYFKVITLTTIGYGDFSPTTQFTKFFQHFTSLSVWASLPALV